jgi:hypothetical protein
MRRRNLQKAVVLIVCFGFLGLSASGLWAGDRTPARTTFQVILNVPAQILAHLFPWLRNFLNPGNPAQTTQPPAANSVTTVKPTGTISSIRLSGGD